VSTLVKYSLQLDFINSVHTFTKYLLEKTLLCVKKYFSPPLALTKSWVLCKYVNEGYKSVAFNAWQQMHAPTRPMSVCHCVMKIGSLYV